MKYTYFNKTNGTAPWSSLVQWMKLRKIFTWLRLNDRPSVFMANYLHTTETNGVDSFLTSRYYLEGRRSGHNTWFALSIMMYVVPSRSVYKHLLLKRITKTQSSSLGGWHFSSKYVLSSIVLKGKLYMFMIDMSLLSETKSISFSKPCVRHLNWISVWIQ